MSLARFRTVAGQELGHTLRRPLFLWLLALIALLSWGMSTGDVQIGSGDASVGGTKAWITSEFTFAFILSVMVATMYSFFAAIASGMAVVADDEARMGELLHSTPLRSGEYVWGKFLAILGAFTAGLLLHALFAAFFNHLVPSAAAEEIRGPFDLMNYLRPALVFGLPMLTFTLGAAFFLGERWRRPIFVFLFPTAVMGLCIFFLWDWTPSWLDPRIDRALMLLDPSGFRWLNQTWIKLDRGAEFYNTARIGLDLPFALSRLGFAALGLLGVALAHRHLAAHPLGSAEGATAGWRGRFRRKGAPTAEPAGDPRAALVAPAPLADLGMRTRRPGLVSGLLRVTGAELKNLLASPGLYVFAALILLQTMSLSMLALGAFQTELLLTPGTLAVRSMNTLSLLVALLLMFYTVESMERERITGLAPIAWSTPLPTAALLLGKALANSAVGVLLCAATFAGGAIALLSQGEVALDVRPYLLVWGLFLLPTLLLWTSFVTAVQAVGGNRFLTYGLGLGAVGFTVFKALIGEMNWVGNWMLWGALRWSDMEAFELDRKALVLNRVLALGLAALFIAVAVSAFGRRQADALNTVHRLRGRGLRRRALRLAPFAVVPLVAGVMLWIAVQDGFEGERAKKRQRDYWKQNLATWKDAPQPSLADVDLSLRLDPAERGLESRGTYLLFNDEDEPLRQFALTGGGHWEGVRWTLNGEEYEPDDRSGLYVFTPAEPLPPGGRVRVGFDFSGRFPAGISKNGGGTEEFILPSGVVLTSFRPTFAPVIGWIEQVGVEEDENDYEPRIYPDDFYQGVTEADFGGELPFTTRIAIEGPADFAYNSVGTKTEDAVEGGRRRVVWESDHPVRFFNVVAGRWSERRGEGTAIYHHPGHAYNVDEMTVALDAARRWYSEWFHPYPWRELKLSEFPNLARYAQGFPTNITFSEGIGFLTRSDEKTDAVFLVTAHEAAHQWWGNLLTPGKGPGGNLLSEGTSHFSTALLLEQVKGPRSRMEFLKRIEEGYGENRRADAERPLVKVDGFRQGDTTVTYDKGGWVFWMLHRHLGRERALAGIQRFFAEWSGGPDYPVLQDFVAAMRPYATDPEAYDDFTRQWFFEVVLPEYRIEGARTERRADGTWETTFTLRNAGTGRMPVAVAVTRGERFSEGGRPGPGWREARSTVEPGAGEAVAVAIRSPFRPERVAVDPDVEVLQLRRKATVEDL